MQVKLFTYLETKNYSTMRPQVSNVNECDTSDKISFIMSLLIYIYN